VLVIAHRLSTVRNADCVCVMQNGTVVQRGVHDDLMAVKGPYRKLGLFLWLFGNLRTDIPFPVKRQLR